VGISSLKIKITGEGDYEMPGQDLLFNGPLAEGSTYLLEVVLRRTRWAGSNVFWDERAEHPDFERTAGTATPTAANTYQGILFMWGSLIGIAPRTGTGPVIYIPPMSGDKWSSSSTLSGYGWSSISAYTAAWDSNLPNESYLWERGSLASYTGDICEHIDDEWRMPSSIELGGVGSIGTTPTGYDHTTFSNGPSSGRSDGTEEMIDSWVRYNSAFGYVIFPASGMRIGSSASDFAGMGTSGIYWSGSPYSAGGAYILSFSSGSVTITQTGRGYALPVRCIRKLAGEIGGR
jgi:hypothetical protein